MPRRPPSRSIVVQGRGAAPGLACGPLLAPDTAPADAAGGVLPTRGASGAALDRILAARATISVGGAVLSHAALLCRERGRPLIVLGAATRVRLLDPAAAGDGSCLELGDLVGAGPTPARLAAGDIVVIDGTVGEMRVHGGIDAVARSRIRAAYDALQALDRGDADAMARVAELAGEGPETVVPFALEAGLECGTIRDADGLRALVAALDSAGPRAVVESALRSIGSRSLERGRRLAGRARGLVAGLEDPDELAAALARAETSIDRERAILVAAARPTAALDAALADLHAAGARRRATMRRELRAAVERTLALPDAAVRGRLAELGRLAWRANSIAADAPAVVSLTARLAELRAEARRGLDDRLVVTLTPDADAPGRGLVGGKAAGIARVAARLPDGCRVPDGFVVTTDGYRLHLLAGPGERLREIVAQEPDDASLSRLARAAILGATAPAEVAAAVRGFAARLDAARWAVRSSAPFEDDARSSLAGVFDTDLGVGGHDEVLERIRSTWASLWNPRAVTLLGAWLRATPDAAIAVVVQRMIPTRLGGVMSTREPGGAADLALVNAWWGLGTAIADGELDGDLYWIRRDGGGLVATQTGSAVTKILTDSRRRGTVAAELAPDERGRPCLDGPRLDRLAELAVALEAAEGPDLEIEFGFDDADVLFVFQCRPVARMSPQGPGVGIPRTAR